MAREAVRGFPPQGLVVRSYLGAWHRDDVWSSLEAELETKIQMHMMY